MSITATEHSLQQRHDEAPGQLTALSGGNFSTLPAVVAPSVGSPSP